MKVIDFNIIIKGIEPAIWRRIKISSQATLLDLHYVIQHAFGWTNSHLFMFEIGSMQFVNPPDWEEDAYHYQSAALATLDDFVPKMVSKGEKFLYVYDMGDGWRHEIFVENIEESQRAFSGAICIAGARACPPEDVGSAPGYYELLHAIKDPTSEAFKDYQSWLGYVYDPETLDLERANQFINDYFKTTQLSPDTYWTKDIPLHNPRYDFISGWLNHISPQDRQYADNLAFRRDVVTLLKYLQENKVRGTKATGNFPRKDIRAITAAFINPPDLDLEIGDHVYSMHTENEVPDLMFMHNFINIAGLILGGENVLWRVTQLGEMFLESSPAQQAWFLTKAWFYQFYWDICYPFVDVKLIENFHIFQNRLLKILLTYPVGKPTKIDQVIDQLDQASPDWLSVQSRDEYARSTKRHYFNSVVIEPFEKIGLFEVLKNQDEYIKSIYHPTHIIMTDYGKNLLMYFL